MHHDDACHILSHAVQNYPVDEHLLPLFVALGVASKVDDVYSPLAMDAWLCDGAV
jgi:hypothetical protein